MQYSKMLTNLEHFDSRETYNALTNWLTDARTLASPNIVIVLVGNKKDLEQEREVTFLEASRFAQENGLCTFQLPLNLLFIKKKKVIFTVKLAYKVVLGTGMFSFS